MAKKLTPWFSGTVKPVRKGVYQQMSGSGDRVGYQFWDGWNWGLWGETISSAIAHAGTKVAPLHKYDPWRGLAQNPKKR